MEDLTAVYKLGFKKWSEKAVNGLIQLPQVSHMFWQVYDKIGDIDVHVETTNLPSTVPDDVSAIEWSRDHVNLSRVIEKPE